MRGRLSGGPLNRRELLSFLRADGRPGRAETTLHSPVHEVVDVDLIAVGADDTSVLPVRKLRLKVRGTLAPTRCSVHLASVAYVSLRRVVGPAIGEAPCR
jgi:hypothetical protein